MNKTYFELFGLEEKLNLDAKTLQKRFYALSKELHPDFHQGGTKAEQAQSLEASAQINQAFLTLKDKEKRLNYLMSLRLGELSEAEKKQTPPELLAELMEIRERLDDFKRSPADEALRASLESSLSDLRAREKTLDAEIDALSETFDAQPNRDAQNEILARIRQTTLKRNFLRSLCRSIEAELRPEEF
ncbi:MAG: Fe-S protein assembly co-chaperone HscB [Chloroherpetonaceae bacterium]|nr:Fe-S protein assembly co-chaperone HscB [Chloroherpetonaceae bacterium]MDW8437369.1 Fe-S protein assembly co-chaperone HscB [Chloroherpetonaceae bacterium]